MVGRAEEPTSPGRDQEREGYDEFARFVRDEHKSLVKFIGPRARPAVEEQPVTMREALLTTRDLLARG